MDDRKHKIYFAMGVDGTKGLFYKYGQTVTSIDQRFDTYEYQTGRVLYLMFYHELEIPEDYENRWAQADLAEKILENILVIFFGEDFSQCGERFYPKKSYLEKRGWRALRLRKTERELIASFFDEELTENNIKFTKGEVW